MLEPIQTDTGVPTREVDGRTYVVSPLPATRAHKLLARILKIVGPSFGQALALATKGGDAGDLDLSALAPAITQLAMNCDPEAMDAIVKELLWNVAVDNRPLTAKNFDLHFQAKILHLYKVVAFALEVNYGDFFGGLRALGGTLKTKVAAGSSSAASTPTTGSSSASTS